MDLGCQAPLAAACQCCLGMVDFGEWTVVSLYAQKHELVLCWDLGQGGITGNELAYKRVAAGEFRNLKTSSHT